MTNIVIVTKADTAKGGAPRVYFDNKHDWADAYYVSKRIDPPEVGATIDADTSSSDFKGKTYWYLNKFKVVTRSSPEAPKTASNGRAATNGAGWSVDAKDCMIFLEVVVKAAFDKSLISDPDELFTWTAATYRAVEQLRSGKVRDFNDKMPPVSVTEAFPDDGLNGPIDDGAPDF